jgi:hypothetical protein
MKPVWRRMGPFSRLREKAGDEGAAACHHPHPNPLPLAGAGEPTLRAAQWSN